MQANSLVTILALFQLLCGLTLAQNHSIGSKNEMPQSLVEGRHVGLDVLRPSHRSPNKRIARIGNARGVSPPWALAGRQLVSPICEYRGLPSVWRTAMPSSAARAAANLRGFVTTLANFNPPSFGCDSDV
jgi:hypothetical protein